VMDKQLQALTKMGPDGYGLSADDSGDVAAAALFRGRYVCSVTVVTPFVAVVVKVVVLSRRLDSISPSIFLNPCPSPASPLVTVLDVH
jgi:hypothetical protein